MDWTIAFYPPGEHIQKLPPPAIQTLGISFSRLRAQTGKMLCANAGSISHVVCTIMGPTIAEDSAKLG
jgi:hypothetical protein